MGDAETSSTKHSEESRDHELVTAWPLQVYALYPDMPDFIDAAKWRIVRTPRLGFG